MHFKVSLFLMMFMLVSCSGGGPGSAKPGNEPGLCPLNCSDAIIAGNDATFAIKPIFSQLNVTCSNGAPSAPIRLQWIVSEEKGANLRPVPFVSFNIVAPGLREIEGGEIVSKVETSSDLRCSDSCGVMTVDINPTCPAVGGERTISMMILSGALVSDPQVDISLTTE